MTPTVLVIATFVGIALLVLGPYYLFILRSETADQDMLRQRIRTGGSAVRATTSSSLLKEAEENHALQQRLISGKQEGGEAQVVHTPGAEEGVLHANRADAVAVADHLNEMGQTQARGGPNPA